MNDKLIPVVPTWHNYFMSMAFLASTRSKDPNTKVGAVLAFPDKSFVTGFNGCPAGFNDDVLAEPNKYPFVIHAECNALDLAGLEKCRKYHPMLYVTIKPCPACSLRLLHYGICNVIYYSEYKSNVHDEDLNKKIQAKGFKENGFYVEHLSFVKYSIQANGEPLFIHNHMGVK